MPKKADPAGPSQEKASNGGLGQQSVNDKRDTWRNQRAEGSTGNNGPAYQVLIITSLKHGWQSHQPHS